MKTCRHCQKHPVNRPRGLCWNCYYRHGVRELYPPQDTLAGLDFHGPAKRTKRPTTALGGTAEKIAVLTDRASKGEQLFHPEDAEGCVLQKNSGRPCEFKVAI